MARIIYGDLIGLANAGHFDVVINPANCFHKMGAGFAGQVRKVWPEVYQRDLETPKGYLKKLGSISSTTLPSGLIVVNGYTQFKYSRTEEVVDYSAIESVFRIIKEDYSGKRIAYPMVGAGLARGNWTRIKLSIDKILSGENHTLVRLPYPIEKVISGGQTGADLGGLLAAERLGILTGGEAPKGYRTEKGKQPILSTRFNLTEHTDWQYTGRTENNVINSDVTILLSPHKQSRGTIQTLHFCTKHNKPYLIINPFLEDIEIGLNFLNKHRPKIINIAGNRESVCEGLTVVGRDWLIKLFNAYK